MDTLDKLSILTDAARFDVACTSSGVDRDAKLGHLGSATCAGICHAFSADGRCITLLKVLFTNSCIYDCAYCVNRRSNDQPRAAFTPRELADLTIEFYRRNFIEGLFISSAVIESPDRTMELLCSCARILREEYGFRGYIHAKTIPGASDELIEELGLLVDRMSVNIELPSQDSLRVLAPDKTFEDLTAPMARIAGGITAGLEEHALARRQGARRFVPAGQSTQLIIGATPENDFQILRLSSALYSSYSLKRVFFSAYLPANDSPLLPDASVEVPLDREHRLYQADWLMRFYEFSAEELIDESVPWLNPFIDPKANWALNHLDLFPIEINTAPYEMLLRVPGLGYTGARAVQRARRYRRLHTDDMKALGLSLKRMRYFVTFDGAYVSDLPFDQDAIFRTLAQSTMDNRQHRRSGGKNAICGQLSLFDSPEATGSVHSQAVDIGDLMFTSWRRSLMAASGCESGLMAPEIQQGQLSAFAAQRERLASLSLPQGAPSSQSVAS